MSEEKVEKAEAQSLQEEEHQQADDDKAGLEAGLQGLGLVGQGVKEKQRNTQQGATAEPRRPWLTSMLGKTMRVTVSDGRVIEGVMLCVDKGCNMVFKMAQEYKGSLPASDSAQQVSLLSALAFTEKQWLDTHPNTPAPWFLRVCAFVAACVFAGFRLF